MDRRQFLTIVKNGDLETVQKILDMSHKLGGTTTTSASAHHNHQHHHHHPRYYYVYSGRRRRILTIPQLFSVRECHGGPTALHLAVQKNHLPLIRVLLLSLSLLQQQQQQHGVLFSHHHDDVVNSSTNDKTPLDLAYEYGHADAATLLLENGGKTTFYSIPEYLLRAIHNNNPDMVRVLLENDCSSSSSSSSTGTGANQQQQQQHVNHIYYDNDNNIHDDDNNQPSSSSSSNSNTTTKPLLMASEKGYARVVSVLLQNGAHVQDKKSMDGNTSLHLACMHGHYQVAKLLLQQFSLKEQEEHHGAGANRTTTNDQNAHYHASTLFAPPHRRHLVASSSSSSRRSSSRLHQKNAKTIVSQLLQQHANYLDSVNNNNDNNKTPLVCAMDRGHTKIACLILEHEIKLACLLLDTIGDCDLEAIAADDDDDDDARGLISPLHVVVANKAGRRAVNDNDARSCQTYKEQLVQLQQSQKRVNELLEKSKKAAVVVDIPVEIVNTQQQEGTTNAASASIMSKDVTSTTMTTTASSTEKHLERFLSQQQQHALIHTAVTDINMKRVSTVLNEPVVHLEEEPKQAQQQKVSVDACTVHNNIDNHGAIMSSIQQLVQTLVSQQKVGQEVLEASLSTLMAAVSDKNHDIETILSAASALKVKQLEAENALLRRRLAHLKDQQQQTAAAPGVGCCKMDNHVATTLNTAALLEILVSQQKYGQNALMAAVVGMKDIETNLVALLQQSIAGFHVHDNNQGERFSVTE